MPTSFVVIDSRVTNFNALIASFAADSEYVVLDLERDGMVQIVEALAGKSGYSSIQIISHGAPGAITLGSTMLDSTALHGYSPELATIGSALLPAGDLMLYGCNVGAGDVGQQFVNMLAQLAGANVAASDDLTGAATFGGDWGLEVQNGAIESVVQPLVGLEGVLANSAPTLSVPTSAVVFASTIDYITGSAAQTVTPNGYASQAIVAADINGDNEIDLVITNSNSATVSVLMNDGNGSFAPKVDYSAGSGPHSVTVADVNNDALPDLVVANNWTNPKISVLLNNGNGIFASQVNYPAGADLYAVTSVDINKDGWMDIIATNASAGTITVLPNNGDGTFPTTTPASYSTGASPLAIASADFNNDGFIDLVVPNSGNSKVSVLFNNGSGGFTEKTDYNTGADTKAIRPVSVIAADFNSDNYADIAVTNFTSGNVSVLLNKGDGTFATITSTPSFPAYPTENHPASLSATDCNGDGNIDLVVANSGSNTVSVLLNNGDGTFAATSLTFSAGIQPYAVATADINNDNKNDIIVANINELSQNRVSVLINTSSVAATSFTEQTAIAVCSNIVLTDSDGDASWNGGSLKVQITGNAETTDTLSLPAVNPNNNGIWLDTSAGNIIMAGTTVIGSADAFSVTSNSKWILTFNDNATNALVQDVARSVMFNNRSDTPSELERVVTFMATDNLGAATSLEQRIAVTAVDEPADNTAPTFMVGDGKVTTDFASSFDYGYSVTVQSDGKILVAGTSANYSSCDFALVRYNSDGSLDTSFDTDGKVTTDFGSNVDAGYSLTVQSDGKILVAGYSDNGTNTNFALVRYNSDGTFDTTFGDNGKVMTDAGSRVFGGVSVNSVVLQSDGKILVGGSSWNGSNYDFALVRYNSDGSLDTSFDTDGKVMTDLSSYSDYGHSVTVQEDGKILVAGIRFGDFALVRYNSDGALDSSFDTDGKATTDIGLINDVGNSVTVQSDGKILVAGASLTDSNYDFAIVRYNRDGSLDTSFDTDGKVTTIFGADYDLGNSVTVQSDGKILVGGSTGNGSNRDFALVRYNSDGSLDTSFDIDGKVTTDFASSSDDGMGVTVQNDGKILVAGYTSGGVNIDDFAIVRYNSDGSLDKTFGAINTIDGTSTYIEGGNAVVLDNDVQIVDAELATLGNYAGSTLTLVRNGGASAEDWFSGAGIVAGSESGTITVAGANIGNYAWSNGSLSMTFNTAATQELVNQAMQSLAYENASDAPPASVQIDWTFNDDNMGSQGSSGALSATGSTTVNVTAVNDVPTVSGPLATTVSEGDPSISLNLLANAHDDDLTDTLSVGNVSYTVNGIPSALPAGITMDGNTIVIDPVNTVYNAMARGEQTTIVATYRVFDSSATAEISFAAKVNYATGSFPYSVTSADVNGDGKTDLIVANYNSDTVSVLNNNGDGTFATNVDYATGDTPYSVTCADLNGDGKADLIVVNHSSNTVSVLNNNGDGTFATKVDYATGSYPESVTSADVNGDGKADLIVANSFSYTVSVMKNNGDGTFTTTDYGTGIGPCSVTSADVNGDGNSDLIVANGGSPSSVSVLTNSGDGIFVSKVNYAMDSASSITSADVNGDGQLDLIVANDNSNTVSVLINNGDGTFATKVDYATGLWPSSVTSADVNGDGKADLIVANFTSNTVSVLNNNGDGTFAAKVDYATGSYPESVTSADVNGDGKPDLIHANATSNTVSVLINNSTGFIGYYPTTTATITINGTNDVPVVDATDVTGAITEMVTPVSNLTDSGTIGFTDVDLSDSHSISSVTPSAGALGTLISTITTDTTGTGVGGVVTWNYSVDASAIEYLAEGEHKVETFTFNILDDNGGSFECSVNVTITGTYDDTIAPTLTASTPSDDATAAAVDSNITFTFSENVKAGTGNIVLSNDTDIRTIDVTDNSQVTFDGDTIIINPTDDLYAGSNYHVEIANGVIQDTAGNAFAGISDAETLDFETEHNALSGHITFWKTGDAITDVTTTLTTLPTDGTQHAIELKNIHVKADGSHTVEVWATTPNSSTGSFECEFVLPTGANATWQDAAKLPAGWTSTSNTITSGNFLVDGMSTKPLAEGQVKLGTLTITTPIEADNLDLLLIGGQLGDNDVEGFGISSVRSATGSGNEYRYHSLADGRYALTADKLAGAREASAVHANDALAALKMAVELNPNDDGSSVLPYQYLAADINQDGKVRANDALNILKMAVGIESVPDDEWIFVSEEVAGKIMDRSHVDWSDLAPTIDFNQTAVEIDFIGIVKGDVDGSWVGVG